MSDERELKLKCLELACGDVTKTQAMFEWLGIDHGLREVQAYTSGRADGYDRAIAALTPAPDFTAEKAQARDQLESDHPLPPGADDVVDDLPEGFTRWEQGGQPSPFDEFNDDTLVIGWMGGIDFVGPIPAKDFNWRHDTDPVLGYKIVTSGQFEAVDPSGDKAVCQTSSPAGVEESRDQSLYTDADAGLAPGQLTEEELRDAQEELARGGEASLASVAGIEPVSVFVKFMERPGAVAVDGHIHVDGSPHHWLHESGHIQTAAHPTIVWPQGEGKGRIIAYAPVAVDDAPPTNSEADAIAGGFDYYAPEEYQFPSGAKTSISPHEVRWVYGSQYEPRTDYSKPAVKLPDGQFRKEPQFMQDQALALLLINEVIFVNTNWWEKEWPEDAKKTTALCVNCSDVFAWGCADAENITLGELQDLFSWWEKDSDWGAAVWCMIKRRMMPQTPVEDRIRKSGKIDLAAVQAEHKLRPSHYNGISMVLARRKYDAYCAWESARGSAPRPFDGKWLDGWREYTVAHPDWNSAEWKAEDDRLCNEWRVANGYEARP